MSSEPMTTAVGREVVFGFLGVGVVDSVSCGPFTKESIDPIPFQTLAMLANK